MTNPLVPRGTTTIAGLLLVGAVLALVGATREPRSPADDLRAELRDTGVGKRWIYDDWAAAVRRATSAKKPICVVIRCVP